MHPGDLITDDAENPEKGLGPRSAPMGTRDIRLLARALNEMWILDPAAKAAAVERLEGVVRDPATKPRAFEKALKALISLGRLNLQAIGVGLNARAQEEIEQRVADIEARIAEKGASRHERVEGQDRED